MPFRSLPNSAAWWHQGPRSGFEVTHFHPSADGFSLTGCTAALEEGQAWVVDYTIVVDRRWRTRAAWISARSSMGVRTADLEADGEGHWHVNGSPATDLDGCLDVDLESSAMTNTLPVHRLSMRVDEVRTAPAAYVRAVDVQVERLEQEYVCTVNDADGQRYAYTAPAFGYAAELVYDGAGLIVAYPGIAIRAG